MRFYQKRQAEMLQMVHLMLKEEEHQLQVCEKVPALKQLIKDFGEKYSKFAELMNWNPHALLHETMNKKLVRSAFAEVVFNLMSVVKAANYKKKTAAKKSGVRLKVAKQKEYTMWALKKMSAERLCELYAASMKEARKISNLQYYGFSAAALRDAQAYYKEFAAIKNAPAKKKKEVAAKNEKIENSIDDCVDFLEQTIDKLMHLATTDNPPLRQRYMDVRAIMPRGQGRPSDAEAAYRKSRHHRPPPPRD